MTGASLSLFTRMCHTYGMKALRALVLSLVVLSTTVAVAPVAQAHPWSQEGPHHQCAPGTHLVSETICVPDRQKLKRFR